MSLEYFRIEFARTSSEDKIRRTNSGPKDKATRGEPRLKKPGVIEGRKNREREEERESNARRKTETKKERKPAMLRNARKKRRQSAGAVWPAVHAALFLLLPPLSLRFARSPPLLVPARKSSAVREPTTTSSSSSSKVRLPRFPLRNGVSSHP